MNSFEEMKNFIRIVDAGSITKAADQTNTVKSAISRKLKELEARLGVSLITRTTRVQTITDLGKSYYQKSIQILDDLAELESSIKDEQCALRGQIKIAAPLSFGLNHLAPALLKFIEIHADIHLDVDFNDRKVDLVEEGYDLAFRIAELKDSNYRAKKITSIRLYLVASPEYLNKMGQPMTPDELLRGHIKVQYKDSPDTWEFHEGQKIKSIKINSVLNSNNGDFLLKAALDGKGLIMTPDFFCYKYVKTGQLIPILCDYIPTKEIGAYAVYPQTRHLSRRVRSLVDYLSQYFGPNPYWQIKSLRTL